MHFGNSSVGVKKAEGAFLRQLHLSSVQRILTGKCLPRSTLSLLTFCYCFTALHSAGYFDWLSHPWPDEEFLARDSGSCECKIRTCCPPGQGWSTWCSWAACLNFLLGSMFRLYSDLRRQIATSACLIYIVPSFTSQPFPALHPSPGLLFI